MKTNSKTIIFHIVHGSFVDGHGIRTTVFLKGCPLRCIWCCNPESQQLHREIKVNKQLCNNCGNCVDVCAAGAISLVISGNAARVQVNRDLCTNCGKCIDVCLSGAIEFFGHEMTVEEVYNNIARDIEYYRRSGGGVTIGGGEPTFDSDFTYSLIKKCQVNNIHVAVDTCGYTRSKKGLKIMEEADLLLFDIKGLDPMEHKRNTTVSNTLILKNLKRLCESGKPIIIRMPLIPGYNISTENIIGTAQFLRQYKNIERVDLLPYHMMGAIKYEQLGRDYKLTSVKVPSVQEIDNIKTLLASYDLNVQIGG